MSKYPPSKAEPLKQKQIQIKPLTILQETVPEKETSLEEEAILVQKELEIMRTELSHLKSEKEQMLTQAITEIKSEKDAWNTEKTELIASAHQEGYAAGFTAGEQDAQEQYSALLAQANDIIASAQADYHQILDDSDNDIIKIAIRVAQKIIKTEIAEDEGVFIEVIRDAIDEIKDQSNVSIYLHPADYQFALEQKQELKTSLDGDAKLELYVDQTVPEHSCVIEHPFGRIDASIDTQLNEIRSALETLVMEQES